MRRRFAVVTSIMVVLTAVAELLQWMVPGWGTALQRDPDGLSRAHWWRLVSPLLTQMSSPELSGTAQFAVNIVMLAVIGYGAERVLGPWRWLAAYVVGGVVGQLTGYWWEPPGGGNSVAVLGVAGLLLLSVVRGAPSMPVSLMFVGYFVTALVMFHFGGWIVTVVSVVLGGWLYQFARGRWPRRADLALISLATVGAIVLTALHDHHGPALLAGGMLLGPLVWRWSPPSASTVLVQRDVS